jgi:hypothetical protein
VNQTGSSEKEPDRDYMEDVSAPQISVDGGFQLGLAAVSERASIFVKQWAPFNNGHQRLVRTAGFNGSRSIFYYIGHRLTLRSPQRSDPNLGVVQWFQKCAPRRPGEQRPLHRGAAKYCKSFIIN